MFPATSVIVPCRSSWPSGIWLTSARHATAIEPPTRAPRSTPLTLAVSVSDESVPSGNVAWMTAADWLNELTKPAPLSALSGTVNEDGAAGATVSFVALSVVVLEFPAGSVTVTASGSGPSGRSVRSSGPTTYL